MNKINLMDKINATTLMLVTSEWSAIKARRIRNNYSSAPTFIYDNHLMDLEFVDILEQNVRFARSVSENKQTLVLLNPFPQSILAYQPIWQNLTQHFDVWAYDLPGFGGSSGGKECMSFQAQGTYLRAFIEHFQLQGVHLVAPDIGMPAVLDYVGRQQHNVKSIMVGDGPAFSPSQNGSVIDKMVTSRFWRRVFIIAGSGALIEAGNRLGYVNYTPNEEEISDYKTSYQNRIPATLKWFEDYPSSLANIEPLLKKVNVPTKIFWGRNDGILLAEMADDLRKIIPDSEVHIFENCGHFSYQDQAGEFLDMVIEWVNKH
ncbi:alpha/beta hydrolase [Vibrio cyclitrophicus]|nr:alpha/beta hydrolase [Vibrio cyclitrophicus]UPR33770.1 alpha/beta hydrolase [Vibrio cyclitrophicus]UPR46664.1 alpha/beta hydrolase [Vibrio cyclitrophicus]